MANSDQGRDKFAEKLEGFVKSLSPEEVSMFTSILHRRSLSDSDLDQVVAGAGSFAAHNVSAHALQAQHLNMAVFKRLLCW
jgi:DNA polymerase sigma